MSTADALTVITEDIYSVQNTFENVQVDKSANFQREAGFAIQVLGANRYAMDTAMANRQSVVDAVVNVAAIGVSLNPAKKQAYLVPRDGKICLDISYMGLMDLAQATGSVRWAQAALVYAGDTFSLTGLDRPPQHSFNPFAKDRGELVGVYVTVKTSDGDYLTHTMTIADVYEIRDRSMAWKKKQAGPWATDEGEMIKKTCVKQASKYWPRADRLDAAINHLNVDNEEGFEPIVQPDRGPVHSATGTPTVPADRKQIIEAVARNMTDLHAADDLIGAYGEYIGITEEDEKVALWKMLPSHIRSAIKKHGESLRETAGATRA